jgi:hypothetical protein
MKLSIQSGEFRDKLERYLPPNALMTDELSPQSLMPGLRVGQSWTVPMYSPFRAPSDPIEVLQALVEREDNITWGGQRAKCRVIVYRPDAGSGLSNSEPRGRVWVRDDGLVLRQEVTVLRSHMQFLRLSDEAAGEIMAELGEDWNRGMSHQTARRLMRQLDAAAP